MGLRSSWTLSEWKSARNSSDMGNELAAKVTLFQQRAVVLRKIQIVHDLEEKWRKQSGIFWVVSEENFYEILWKQKRFRIFGSHASVHHSQSELTRPLSSCTAGAWKKNICKFCGLKEFKVRTENSSSNKWRTGENAESNNQDQTIANNQVAACPARAGNLRLPLKSPQNAHSVARRLSSWWHPSTLGLWPLQHQVSAAHCNIKIYQDYWLTPKGPLTK